MLMRNVTLRMLSAGINITLTLLINRKMQKSHPELYTIHDFTEDQELIDVVKDYAKLIGVTVGIAAISAVIATIVVTQVDHIVYPDQTGAF